MNSKYTMNLINGPQYFHLFIFEKIVDLIIKWEKNRSNE